MLFFGWRKVHPVSSNLQERLGIGHISQRHVGRGWKVYLLICGTKVF